MDFKSGARQTENLNVRGSSSPGISNETLQKMPMPETAKRGFLLVNAPDISERYETSNVGTLGLVSAASSRVGAVLASSRSRGKCSASALAKALAATCSRGAAC